MKKKLLLLGPLPPPLQGETIAFNALVSSRELKENFNFVLVNSSMGKSSGGPGKITIKKILRDTFVFIKTIKIITLNKFDVFYISISQTKYGLIRDLIIINLVKKKSNSIIAHLHGNNLGNLINSFNGIFNKFVRNSLTKIDKGVVLGENLTLNFQDLAKEVIVVENGVEDFVKSNLVLESSYSNKSNRSELEIVYLSNLIKSKGFINLIEACIELIESGEKIKLKLAGAIYDDYDFQHIMKDVVEKRMENKIVYLGIVNGDEKNSLLINSDIMVLPTAYPVEGQPLSIIEGMAAGLPIISTKKGSIPNLIKDNGILLENNDKNAIKESIKSLIHNKNKRIEMGRRSRKYYEQNYTIKNYIEKLIHHFNI